MPRITQKEISRLVGVSQMTVHRALAEDSKIAPKTRESILAACQKYGYRKSHVGFALKNGRSLLIGLVSRGEFNHAMLTAIGLLQEGLVNKGYNITIVKTGTEGLVPRDLAGLISKHVEGLIITGIVSPEACELLRREKIPAVYMIERPQVSKAVCFVGSDDEVGTRLVMQKLFELGHRRIVHIASAHETFGGIQRRETYRTEMERKGYPSMISQATEWDCRSGCDAMNLFLDRNQKFTAVFAASDKLAIGAARALQLRGFRIPEDVSLVGFGNADEDIIANLVPALTTVGQRRDDIAVKAVEYLTLLLANEDKSIYQNHLITPVLIERESCAPCKTKVER